VKRGDVVLTVLPGDYGQPRPAVVVQGDAVTEADYGSVVVCPMTSATGQGLLVRVPVAPNEGNGLRADSEIMVEKLAGVSTRRLRGVIGRLDAVTMRAVDQALSVVLGFA
jgi:mRNA interferase MazF